MRGVAIILLSTSAAISVQAQDTTEYRQLLDRTTELVYSDSLHFSSLVSDTTLLDSTTVKKYFSSLLSSGANKFKNKSYSLLGKITRNKNFDLIVVLEEKKRADSSAISVVYLVSLKKSGDYISNMKVIVNGTKKKSGSDYNINSTLLAGNRIIQDSRIMTREQLYNEVTSYKIIAGGRFILDSNN